MGNSPILNQEIPEEKKKTRLSILTRLLKSGHIDEEEFEMLYEREVEIMYRDYPSIRYSPSDYFTMCKTGSMST